MANSLAGVTFIYNGILHDYCYRETIQSLKECCDMVIVVECGSTDGTREDILTLRDNKVMIVLCDMDEWSKHHGKEKLAYFSGVGEEHAQAFGFDYMLVVQCDEVISERSYAAVRQAIATGKEAYMCSRINLWESPFLKLNVPQDRKPCSTEVIRLAKTNFRSVDDAENLGVGEVDMSFIPDIRIYHFGFVRKREVMKSKITHMQVDIFGMSEADNKLKLSETFNPRLWFGPEDLVPIDEPLPKIMKQWALERVYE
jgi:hypothetical protein